MCARNNFKETDNQLIARYIGGLKEANQDKLGLNSVWSLLQAVNFAFKAEQQMQQTNRGKLFRDRIVQFLLRTTNRQATVEGISAIHLGRTIRHKLGVMENWELEKENQAKTIPILR